RAGAYLVQAAGSANGAVDGVGVATVHDHAAGIAELKGVSQARAVVEEFQAASTSTGSELPQRDRIGGSSEIRVRRDAYGAGKDEYVAGKRVCPGQKEGARFDRPFEIQG